MDIKCTCNCSGFFGNITLVNGTPHLHKLQIMFSSRHHARDSLKWIYMYLFLFLLAILPPGFGSKNHVAAHFGYPLRPPDSGQVRLKGMHNGEGIVEVRHRSNWGLICANRWTMSEGDVACRQLGYDGVTRVMRVSPGRDDRVSFQVFLNGTECEGTESALVECRHSGFGNFTEMCQPLELPWVSCVGAESPQVATTQEDEEEIRNNIVPASVRLLMPATTVPLQTFPPLSVQHVGSDRVTISWLHWYDHLRETDPSAYRVRIVIKYRRLDEPGAQSQGNYTIAAETPTYWTHYTITGLQELVSYEFVVESVGLSILGGEVTEPSSLPINVTTVCGGPQPVQHLQVGLKEDNATILHVRWFKPLNAGCPAQEYIVEYQQTNTEHCHELDTASRIVLSGLTSHTKYVITDLHPFSTYTVLVTAKNRFGRSTQVNVTRTTPESVPTAVPVNIAHNFQRQNALKITWDQPPCGQRGGNTGLFQYMLIDVSTDSVTHRGSTRRKYVHLPGVDSLQRYKFLVAARTSAGLGPFAVASIPVEPNILQICGKTQDSIALLASRPGPSARISSGLRSARGSAPWMAQLWSVPQGGMFCAGSILNEYWILTAAHCIEAQGMTTSSLKIQLGDFDTSLPETHQRAYDVASIVVHENFNERMFDNDIALIKLAEPIEFSEFVRPICVPTTKMAKTLLTTGRTGRVAGWGRQGTGGQYPRFLKQVFVPIVRRKTCRQATDYSFTTNMFCAGYSQANLGDACEGDSGAPFIVQHTNERWYVLGTVSWGDGCDLADRYGYYTRLHKYTSWIKRHSRVTL